MKNYNYSSVLKYTGAGILLGLMLMLNGYLLNRQHGFTGAWFHIFDYSPDFIIIAISPLVIGLLSCFIGIRWQQLVAFNQQIKNNLSQEQAMSLMVDKQFKLLGKVVSQINEAVIISDNTGCILWANQGFTKITGYGLEDVIGKKGESFLVGPLSQKTPMNNIKLNMYKGESVVEEMVHYRKEGTPYWAMISVTPIYNETNEITNYIAIETDITIRKEKELALEKEIKERKELEAQLLANKNKLEQAIEIAQVGAWESDSVNKTYYISKELRTIYNMPLSGDLHIDDIFKNIHPDDMPHVWKSVEKAAKGETNELEYRYNLDGECRHMLSNIAPRIDADGNFIGYAGTVKDITQRKLFELAIKKSEEEKTAVLENAQAIICKHSLNGIIIDVNPAAEKLSGYSKNELIGSSLQKLISDEYREYFDLYLNEIINNKNANGSFQIIRKDGNKRAWLYQNTLYNNTQHGEPYIIASAIDITESVKAQNEIEKQQAFISQIIENSPNMIYVLNELGQVVLHNKTFSHYYLCNQSTAPNLHIAALSKGDKDIFLGDFEAMLELEDGEMIRLEGSMQGTNCTNDPQSWFNVIKKCFTDKKGKKYILVIGMDITGRYQIETDLIAANELVERSLKVKDQFISNMSHEIRTPLNAVIGFTDLLQSTSLNKEQAEFVDIIQSASEKLLGLINNILDLSKIESGNLSLESKPIDIQQIVKDAVKILLPKTKEKGLELRCRIAETIPDKVLGDQLRLSQILFNLLGNAIKFTHTGYVEIGCRPVKGSDEMKDYISFYVKDTGIGVAKEKQAAIFERFTQANADTERLYGGTGLGLNIAKGIVDMHGGSLTINSTTGKGTTFEFILRFDKCKIDSNNNLKRQENKTTQTQPGKNIRVLLAEDNAINAMLAKQVLENGGFTVMHVANGSLAVAAVQQQNFDVVLMDIQMPVLSGIAATEQIRALQGPASKIPVVAMTAHSLYGEMQHCYKAGMTGYVSKPFKPAHLFAAIIESIDTQNSNKKLTNTIDDMIKYTY